MSEIKQLIDRGEGKTIEFKENVSDGKNIAKSVIAFSNTAGGKIIIGVEDQTHRINGISDDDVLDFPGRISNIIHESCYPFILPEIYIENVDDTKVLVIEVFPGALKPYYLKKKGKKGGTYIRVNATNKPADMEMLMELERQRRNISFDEELNYELDDGSLDLEQLKTDLLHYTGKKMDANAPLNLRLLQKEQDRIYPTVGGLLLAAKTPHFEYARIKCARFKGTTMDHFIDQKEFSGPLYRQVENAMNFGEVYIAKSGKVERLQRIDRYEVPLEVIREALVNAVVHRDYSISGAYIKFAIFDDRIEITSPGALPRSLEIRDIISGRSEIRNKIIARFFREISFIEQWGTGIQKIIRLLKEHGLEPPQFLESGLYFKIIISKKKKSAKGKSKKEKSKTTPEATPKTTSKTTLKTTPKITSKNPSELLETIRNNPYINLAELAESLNLTRDGVKYHIKNLKQAGQLKRVGSTRNGHWEVSGQ